MCLVRIVSVKPSECRLSHGSVFWVVWHGIGIGIDAPRIGGAHVMHLFWYDSVESSRHSSSNSQ